MTILPDVNAHDVHPFLWLALGAIACEHRTIAGQGLIVTSLRRALSDKPSRHSPPPGELVTAADLRRWALDDLEQAEQFCRILQTRFGVVLGVVLEPEWLSEEELTARGGFENVQPHIHVQLKRTDLILPY